MSEIAELVDCEAVVEGKRCSQLAASEQRSFDRAKAMIEMVDERWRGLRESDFSELSRKLDDVLERLAQLNSASIRLERKITDLEGSDEDTSRDVARVRERERAIEEELEFQRKVLHEMRTAGGRAGTRGALVGAAIPSALVAIVEALQYLATHLSH